MPFDQIHLFELTRQYIFHKDEKDIKYSVLQLFHT